MKMLDLCSGIGGISSAAEMSGMHISAHCEIDAHAQNVLRYHWQDTPIETDMADPELIYKYKGVDVVAGGTPCQAFSVAGKRKGLDDERGNLALIYCRIVHGTGAKYAVWENVPGVLSERNNAFGCFLAELVGADSPCEHNGKRWSNAGVVSGPQGTAAWVVRDTKYHGVPQQRRRVICIFERGTGAVAPIQILFERDCLCGYPAPSRKTEQVATPAFSKFLKGNSGGIDREDGHTVIVDVSEVANCLQTTCGDYSRADGFNMVAHCSDIAPSMTSSGPPLSRTGNSRVEAQAMVVQGVGVAGEDVGFTLRASPSHSGDKGDGGMNCSMAITQYGNKAGTLTARYDSSPCADRGQNIVAPTNMRVRRLMPVECERLQSFPDHHTLYGRKPDGTIYEQKDGQRYKQLGNSVTRIVFAEVFMRLVRYDKMKNGDS